MRRSALDVVVVGNVGIDTNVYLNAAGINFSVESNFTNNIDNIGQAGGYSCLGFSRLGKSTAFIGYIGDDYFGDHIRREFIKRQIDTTALFTDPHGTSRSINFVYEDGRRKNFYDGKSHMSLKPDMNTCRQVLSRARLAHFHLPNWARTLLPVARELGLRVACDLQDLNSVDDPYRQDFINNADILFASTVNYADPTSIIRALLDRNPQAIVVSGRGSRGCALGTSEGIQFFDPVDMQLPVVDTNGAGDSLAVGFLSSYVLDGYSLEESILRGQIAARYACTIKGSSAELIDAAALDDAYQRYLADS
jgi:sugar/nucleoside kinase (ribokinase family)